MKNALLVLEVILGLVVIVAVLVQPSKSDALSGLVQGSKNETFYSRNKSRTKEVKLERLTMIAMILFAAVALALNIIK
ncbi:MULTISPECIES: preprotein translocase subunit SecG [Clostridium]|uniref:Protein-export membrane protein SecG n=1 Tax=Clostridium cibarium TaxID=2762247 RepID=A0ABR8PSV6_9CLOT|nr:MULTISPECIES: preprotein translocase subunit SecG [Clostridium]MBD7911256.1 preprotein translocase subunit SecG [Clostridium cibarium]